MSISGAEKWDNVCMLKIAILFVLLGFTCTGCANALPTGGLEMAFETQDKAKFRVETVASGLQVPWGFAWLPNGDMLVTERPGRVRIIEKGKLRIEPVFTVPD